MWVSGPSRVSTWPCQVGWCWVQSGAHVPSGGEQVERATPCLGLGDPATSHLLQVLLCMLPNPPLSAKSLSPRIYSGTMPVNNTNTWSLTQLWHFPVIRICKNVDCQILFLVRFCLTHLSRSSHPKHSKHRATTCISLFQNVLSFNIKCLPWSLKRQKCWTSIPTVLVLEFEAPKMSTRTYNWSPRPVS